MAEEFTQPVGDRPVRRRTFLQGAAGFVGVTILGVPVTAAAEQELGTEAAAPQPGVATQRIDGRAKVSGQKIFARDYNARDLAGWGQDQWYAMYLCALTTDRAFRGVKLSALPPDAQPTRIVLGDQLHEHQRLPRLTRTRDLMVESVAREMSAHNTLSGTLALRSGLSSVVEYDLIVKPGSKPDYLGQGVALLLFNSLSGYKAARRFMQFRDADFQIYAPTLHGAPKKGEPYSPQTTYVKYFEDGEEFSYVVADPKTYLTVQVPAYRQKINSFVAKHPEFTKRDIAVDTQAMDPMFMEPESGLVYYDSVNARLHLLLGTQSPDADVEDILSMYGSADSPIKVKEIELTSCYPGGGFGGRDSSPFSLLLALAASFSNGKPVKLAQDRFEQFRLGLKRPGVKIRGQLVVGPDMKLKSIAANLDFNGGGLKNLSPYVASLASLCMGGAYDIPTANIFAQSIHTEDIPGGSQRGFGGPEAFFAVETAFDDVIAAKGWDAIAARRVNLAVAASRTVVGGPIAQELRLGEMLDRTAAHPIWADREKIKGQYAAKGLTYGTGLAMSLQAYGTSGDGMVAAVYIDRDGALKIQSDAIDMGNGSATTLAVVVGPILGRNADSIEMGCYRLFGLTGLTTSDSGNQRWTNPKWTQKAVGSSSACLTALHQVHVVQQTANALLHGAVLPAARLVWGKPTLPVTDLLWRNGDLTSKSGAGSPIPRARLAGIIYSGGLPIGALGHAYFQATWAEADYGTQAGTVRLKLDGLSFYSPDAPTPKMIVRQNTQGPGLESKRYSRYVWAPCVNVVGLVVNKTDGSVRVENVLSVLNAGRLLVPQLVSGQSQGGVAMAIGYALMEDMPDGMSGPANGRWNLDRYHVPRWGDVPLLDAYAPGGRAQELIVLPETPGDQGAGRGIAEAVMCSIVPAISNALRDATGRRFTSLPITPDKILKELRG